MVEIKEKLFSEKQVDISAIIAGPIPPGILIYKNYKALGKDKEANITLASTIIFTIVFFYSLMQLSEEVIDKIPNFVFTAFYGILVFLFFRKFMAEDVKQAYENGADKRSNWSVAGLTILGLALNLAIILALASSQPYYDGERIMVDGNEIFYDEDIPIEDVNKLINHFKNNDFFGKDYGNLARLQKINDEYFITMYVDKQLWSDPNTISYATNSKWLMEVEFGKKTYLKLESSSLSGVEYNYITD